MFLALAVQQVVVPFLREIWNQLLNLFELVIGNLVFVLEQTYLKIIRRLISLRFVGYFLKDRNKV